MIRSIFLKLSGNILFGAFGAISFFVLTSPTLTFTIGMIGGALFIAGLAFKEQLDDRVNKEKQPGRALSSLLLLVGMGAGIAASLFGIWKLDIEVCREALRLDRYPFIGFTWYGLAGVGVGGIITAILAAMFSPLQKKKKKNK